MTIQEYVERGRAAVEAIKDYDQAQVDKLVYEAGKIIYQHAAELAREAVDETGLGYYEDKIGKNTDTPAGRLGPLHQRPEPGGVRELRHLGQQHPVRERGLQAPDQHLQDRPAPRRGGPLRRRAFQGLIPKPYTSSPLLARKPAAVVLQAFLRAVKGQRAFVKRNERRGAAVSRPKWPPLFFTAQKRENGGSIFVLVIHDADGPLKHTAGPHKPYSQILKEDGYICRH